MALYEYHCNPCGKVFEEITSSSNPEPGKCPHCQGKDTQRLISRFAVGGQGDLRESASVHGCHDYTGVDSAGHVRHEHDHDHGHSHEG